MNFFFSLFSRKISTLVRFRKELHFSFFSRTEKTKQVVRSFEFELLSLIVDSGFQVLDSSLCQWNLDSGFQYYC